MATARDAANDWGDELNESGEFGPLERSGGSEGSEAKTLVLVSPATEKSNNGNWHTAHRWSQFLHGHCDTTVMTQWPPASRQQPGFSAPALMIALHARRSAASIAAWARAHPHKPLVLVLTGTDLYRDIAVDASAQQSLELASHLVVLQEDGLGALPAALRGKAQVIYQSAPALRAAVKSARSFTAVMVGHLRDEKDPLTFMRAASDPLAAGTRFVQIGEALDDALGNAARMQEKRVPGYRWLGGLPRAETRQRIKRAHVLVNCSHIEGGAHVILEAVQSATPVLTSRVGGNLGMLGVDYAGYFQPGDHAGLAALVRRCRLEPDFMARLKHQCAQRAPLFAPHQEKRHVLNLVHSALSGASRDTVRAPQTKDAT